MGRRYDWNGFHERLGCSGRMSCDFGIARGWILPCELITRTILRLDRLLNVIQGCVYLLSTWYVRYDMGKRYSVFYLLGVVASAFSGILAFGLMQMHGLAGLGGWRYAETLISLENGLSC